MHNPFKSIVIILAALLATQLMPFIWHFIAPAIKPYVFSNQSMMNILANGFMLLPLLACVSYLFPEKSWYYLLGLKKNYKAALSLALIATLPMFIGYSLNSNSLNLSIKSLIDESLRPAFFQEIIFRGFLFGLLFKYCRWGFIPAALISSALLIVGNLPADIEINSLIAASLFTAIGGIWFAWLYAEFEFNLWIPLFLHALMNWSVALYDVAGGIALNPESNIFRMMTIALTVIFTIIIKRQRGFSTINKSRLWFNQQAS
jgi:hypothetical protein